MGNCWSCCAFPGQDKSAPSLESTMRSVADADSAERIDLLIAFIEEKLKKMKGSTGGTSTSTSTPTATSSSSNQIKSVASITRLAADVVNRIKTEDENLKNSELLKALGSRSLEAVKLVAESHWIFLGLSVAAYALEMYVQINKNVSECMELLENIVQLAKDVNKFREAVREEIEKVQTAVKVIVEGAIL